MLADYLDIPKPHQTIFPMGCSCVVQNHWGYTKRLRRVFYLHRDGRDVCVSTYHYCLRALGSKNVAMRDYFAKRLPRAAHIENWTHDKCAEFLPDFIEAWAAKPFGCRHTWSEHINQWSNQPHVVSLSYEQLRKDCHATLAHVIPVHTGVPIDDRNLARTIDKYSFENQSGRKPGQEDSSSFMRKGIVGDWRNHFTLKAGEVFDSHFGEKLIRLGYENDRDWFREIPTQLENPASLNLETSSEPNERKLAR